MKKYLFGLGAMLVGAGLMFVLMHGEVSAEGEAGFDFICKYQSTAILNTETKKYRRLNNLMGYECKKGNTTCYTRNGGLACFNTGIII